MMVFLVHEWERKHSPFFRVYLILMQSACSMMYYARKYQSLQGLGFFTQLLRLVNHRACACLRQGSLELGCVFHPITNPSWPRTHFFFQGKNFWHWPIDLHAEGILWGETSTDDRTFPQSTMKWPWAEQKDFGVWVYLLAQRHPSASYWCLKIVGSLSS